MKKLKLFSLFILMLSTINVYGGKPKEVPLKYDIVCAGSALDGYYLVKVSAYADKSSQISNDLVKKCAIHGVLFRGFSGSNGCTSQKPLALSPSTEQEHNDFFKAFFSNGGKYMNYATIIDGSITTEKVGKQYKITATISIAKTILRNDLEKAGIIKSLSNGF